MANPYRQILAVPGTAAFTLPALAARTAHLMTVLSIFFFIPAVTGSYGLAGALSGIYALTYSLVSPFVSRLASRDRPGRVLASAASVNTLARAGLLASAWAGAPVWITACLAAAAGGSMPAAGPLARARWSQLLRDSPLLHTALSFESVLDQIILVTTPILVATLAVAISPAAGLVIALVLATAGNTALAALAARPAGLPMTGRARPTASGTPWSAPGFLPLILTFVLVGAVETLIDLNVVVFAARHHAKPLSGAVLTTIALASTASGLYYGSREQRAAPSRRLPVALGLLTCGTLPFVVAPDVWFLFPAAVLLGFTQAPAVITGFATVRLAVKESQVTEGLTWITAALGGGIALGSVTAGQIAASWDSRAAFCCAVGGAGAAALAGYVVRQRCRGLRRRAGRGSGGLVGAPAGERRIPVQPEAALTLGYLRRPVRRRHPPHHLELDAARVLGVHRLGHPVVALPY